MQTESGSEMIEQRQASRSLVQGLHATIEFYSEALAGGLRLEGQVLDISYLGIKIQLAQALPDTLAEAQIKITLQAPSSAVPMVIKGKIRHQSAADSIGVQYMQLPGQKLIDKLVFECQRRAG